MEAEHPEKIGNYEVLAVIGKGGMGRVYKAAHPPENTVVAIKVLAAEAHDDEESRERFEREAEAISLIRHPNIVRVIERGQENDSDYLVMEYVPGTSLASVLRQRRLSLPEAIRVFKGICAGIEAAHAKGVVHRDLSPRNVLVSEDLTTVKIADFGISRVESVSATRGTLSTTEFSLGSLHYIAPEQIRDMASADHRADIYSLGVVFYEMLTGRVPVGRFSLPSQLNSEVPSDIDPIVLRCLEVKPEKRFPAVTRLLREVRRLEDQLRLGLVHEVRGLGDQTTKIILKSTGHRNIRIALAALVVVGIGAAAFFTIGRPAPQTAPEPEPTEPVVTELADGAPAGELEDDPIAGATAEAAVDDPPEDSLIEESAQTDEPSTPDDAGTQKTQAPNEGRTEAKAPRPSPPTPTAAPRLAEDLEVARNKFEAGLLDPAREDVEAFLESYPRSKLAPQAYLLLGRIEEAKGLQDQARGTYVELQSRFGDSDAAAESGFRSAKMLQAETGKDAAQRARLEFAEVVQSYPQSPWAPKALIEKAALEIADKVEVVDATLKTRVPAALVTYRTLIADYPSAPGAEDALWYLGQAYGDLKEFELAAEALEQLGSRFPDTRHDVWWTVGQIYDRRLDDDDRAIAAYEKVPSSSRRHNDAQRRINKLSR